VTYRLGITSTAARQLTEKLPEPVAAACFEFVTGPLLDNPRRVGTPLHAPFHGQWRARRGEYRIRYLIDDEEGIVTVVDVEHRRDAYRTR
jgi:mRNA-degrading endonuclease RelE of RelBE toxin-antitoxin system